jgi:hypothetical protein
MWDAFKPPPPVFYTYTNNNVSELSSVSFFRYLRFENTTTRLQAQLKNLAYSGDKRICWVGVYEKNYEGTSKSFRTLFFKKIFIYVTDMRTEQHYFSI